MSEEKAITTVTEAITAPEFTKTYKGLIAFVKTQLKEAVDGVNGDYGVIPYTGKKKSLLKPGAEKLAKFFGLVPAFEKLSEVEEWDKGFVYYKYRCVLTHFASGKAAGEAIRSSNSREKWMAGKSVYESANSVDAKAQKRAFVAAVVQATMASEIFDADVSESDDTPPERPVTKEEDPRRIQVMNTFYGTATRHGLGNNWIHAAAKKKFGASSLTDLSNDNIIELTELIYANYVEVAKGESPKRKEEAKQEEKVIVEKTDVIEADVVPSRPTPYECQGKKHEANNRPATTTDDPWCSPECQEEYYGAVNKTGNTAFAKFMKEQQEKKASAPPAS